MSYAISYQADYAERRNRLTIFFRFLTVIPHMVVAIVWQIVGFFTAIAAWFALVVTGRYPGGLYELNSGILRFFSRLYAYAYLQTDAYPPFGLAEAREYPVRVEIGAPQQTYSRVLVFFRFLLGIPVYIVISVFSYALMAVAFVGWIVGVVTGKMPRGLYSALDFLIGYTARGYAYMALLLTDGFPPFTDPAATAGLPPGGSPYGTGTLGPAGHGAAPAYGSPSPTDSRP